MVWVTPCYNEEANVRICRDAVRQIFQTELPGYDYEHIFCDNASQDGTVAILREMAGEDSRVKVILNSRNFGPFRSMFNGILSASGDAVLCFLPADLQDPVEMLPKMVRLWEQGHEIVYGIRAQREESLIMRTVRRTYYRLVSRLANINIPMNVGEFQLVDRCVIAALRQFDDYYPYIRGMIASCGFRNASVEYVWKRRAHGFSKNRLYDLIDQGTQRPRLIHQRPVAALHVLRPFRRGPDLPLRHRRLCAQYSLLSANGPAGHPHADCRVVLLLGRPSCSFLDSSANMSARSMPKCANGRW